MLPPTLLFYWAARRFGMCQIGQQSVPLDALWNSDRSTKLEENFFSGGFRREKIKRFGRDRYHVGCTELCGDRGRAGAGAG